MDRQNPVQPMGKKRWVLPLGLQEQFFNAKVALQLLIEAVRRMNGTLVEPTIWQNRIGTLNFDHAPASVYLNMDLLKSYVDVKTQVEYVRQFPLTMDKGKHDDFMADERKRKARKWDVKGTSLNVLNPSANLTAPVSKVMLASVDVLLCFVESPQFKRLCLVDFRLTKTDGGVRYVGDRFAVKQVVVVEPPLINRQVPVDRFLASVFQRYSATSIAVYNWRQTYFSGQDFKPSTPFDDRMDHLYFWGGKGTGVNSIPLSFSQELNKESNRTMQGPLQKKYFAIQFRAGAWLWTEGGTKTIRAEATMLVNHALSLMPPGADTPVFVASDLYATRPMDMTKAVKMRQRMGWSEERLSKYKKELQTALKGARETLQKLNVVHHTLSERYEFEVKTPEALVDWIIAANSTLLLTNTIGRYRMTLHHARHIRSLPSWQCNTTV